MNAVRRAGLAVLARAVLARAVLARAVLALAVGAEALLAVSACAGRTPASSARWQPGPDPSSTVDSNTGGPPTRLRIPSLGVDTALVDLRLDDKGALEVPKDFHVAGWYADGTRPGDAGPAIIAGHVDSKQGPAVFFRLHELKVGDTIEVARDERWLAFRVVDLERYPKDQFPTDKVHGPTPGAELRLITCGGAFNSQTRSYRDNVVVYAILS